MENKARKGSIKIIYNKSLFVIIALLILVLVILLLFIREIPKNGEKECLKDEDCVKQQATCCSCSMGGVEKCMGKQNASYWKSKLEECEKDMFCIAMYNCQETKCGCIDGKCVEKLKG